MKNKHQVKCYTLHNRDRQRRRSKLLLITKESANDSEKFWISFTLKIYHQKHETLDRISLLHGQVAFDWKMVHLAAWSGNTSVPPETEFETFSDIFMPEMRRFAKQRKLLIKVNEIFNFPCFTLSFPFRLNFNWLRSKFFFSNICQSAWNTKFDLKKLRNFNLRYSYLYFRLILINKI